MRSNESSDLMRLGLELSMYAAFCLMLVIITLTTISMFSYKDEQDGIKDMIKSKGDKYFLEYAEHIYGTDIVEFIIKYDATFNYNITLKNGKTFGITSDIAKELWADGENGNEIWTQDYLTNIVLGDTIYKEFEVTYKQQNDNSIDYYIYEK